MNINLILLVICLYIGKHWLLAYSQASPVSFSDDCIFIFPSRDGSAIFLTNPNSTGIEVDQSSRIGDCPTNIFGRDNYFYVLSDNQTNANDAQQICMISGGTLAETQNSSKQNDFIGYAVQRHIPSDLVLVRIYTHPNWTDVFKYRPIASEEVEAHDETNLTGWGRPALDGELRSITLYASPRGRFNTKLYFCWFYGRDTIEAVPCLNGWKPNFELYGGSSQSNETIAIYNCLYKQERRWSTSLFLRNNTELPDYLVFYRIHYIPDISVLVGARSDVGQSDWFWNNGKISDANFPTTNSTVCQQLTWPLTYDDGINLRGKLCNDEAYFICEFKFEFQVGPVACNGSTLQATWNRLELQQITNETEGFYVQFSLDGNDGSIATFKAPFNDASYTFTEVLPRTSYTVEASVQVENCDQIDVSVSTTATTFYGIPEPATNARVVNDTVTSDCVIEWQHKDSDLDVLYYTILINASSSMVSSIEVCDPVMTNHDSLQHAIDTSSYAPNSLLHFQIRATTCEGASDAINVAGTCFFPPESLPKQTSNFNVVYVIVPVVVVVFFGLLSATVIVYKRRKQSESHYVDAAVTQPDPTNNSLQHYENAKVPPKIDEAPFLTTSVAVRPRNSTYTNESVQAAAAESTYANESPLNFDPSSAYENNTNDIASSTDKHFYVDI